jgi:hypothetical protein
MFLPEVSCSLSYSVYSTFSALPIGFIRHFKASCIFPEVLGTLSIEPSILSRVPCMLSIVFSTLSVALRTPSTMPCMLISVPSAVFTSFIKLSWGFLQCKVKLYLYLVHSP